MTDAVIRYTRLQPDTPAGSAELELNGPTWLGSFNTAQARRWPAPTGRGLTDGVYWLTDDGRWIHSYGELNELLTEDQVHQQITAAGENPSEWLADCYATRVGE